MSDGNKRPRKKCRWNICHLGINVVQSFKLNNVNYSKKNRAVVLDSYSYIEFIPVLLQCVCPSRAREVQNQVYYELFCSILFVF